MWCVYKTCTFCTGTGSPTETSLVNICLSDFRTTTLTYYLIWICSPPKKIKPHKLEQKPHKLQKPCQSINAVAA